MADIFQPSQRKLTEAQLAEMINGTELTDDEMEALRWRYGLCDRWDSVHLLPDRLAAAAERKIMASRRCA